ncbi:alpha/beta fold hydrolase, partial [Deinococcus sp. 6GRE01]|uniref:alpha/beta fold hydrolase n=1 Tax=Deinococcus sp. 6GRE01 TaxID=2745873 RepID=UPI001E49680C
TVPVTVLAGRQDRLSPPAQHADLLTRLLPDATQLDLPGGGHQLHWTHPQEVAGAVRAALGVASRSSGPPDA